MAFHYTSKKPLKPQILTAYIYDINQQYPYDLLSSNINAAIMGLTENISSSS